MKTVLFTNYGNLAFIKRDSSMSEPNDYIDKVYEITTEVPKLLKHLSIYEHIDKPRVAETRTRVLLDDVNSECLVIELEQTYKDIRYILLYTNLDTMERCFYAFNICGDFIENIGMNQVLETLCEFYDIQINFESFENKIEEILHHTSNFAVNRTKLHKTGDYENLDIMGLNSF